ncbi:hypothetical protein L1987_80720 [Smallanthus sonchifolius]|uniref:Uncharacterized protein n=1 Tax=Smallanthus sonchifolius TaxID=185202 RepID=A0ACB8YPN3_9ASTR|nr:hypothetical protein L1987_80720 [Smallanthus sonchifolius]
MVRFRTRRFISRSYEKGYDGDYLRTIGLLVTLTTFSWNIEKSLTHGIYQRDSSSRGPHPLHQHFWKCTYYEHVFQMP